MNAIIVFAKYPEEGNVKTRLAATTDKNFAYKFYKLCCAHIFDEINELSSKKLKCFLFYTGSDKVNLIKEWVGFDFEYALQQGSDLGEKMKNAFEHVFAKGFSKALIIGTDIPDINKSILNESLEILNDYDYVISPSADGGYNYLGMKKINEKLFDNIKWSTSEVFPKTIERINRETDNYKINEELIDIDTEDELLIWLNDDKGNNPLKEKVKNLFAERKNKL